MRVAALAVLAAILPFVLCQEWGFVFTAPKRFTSGREENLCIAFQNETRAVGVFVKVHGRGNREIASTKEIITGEKCFNISIPRTRSKKGRLFLYLADPTETHYSVNYYRQILINSSPDVVFIVTDKPVYSGGHVVKFRIFVIRSDLTPVRGENVEKIWIENPNGVHLAQWLNESTGNGFLDKTFRLSREPLTGTWNVKVRLGEDDVTSQPFSVEDYVLPRFSVSVNAPKFVETRSPDFNVTVCARYMFGEPVHGIAHVHAYVKCSFAFYCNANRSSVRARRLGLDREGCVSHRFLLSDMSTFAQRIVVNATVRETGTDVEASSAATIELTRPARGSALEFTALTKQRQLKPKLPFRGQVVRRRSDSNESLVRLCLVVNSRRTCSRANLQNDSLDFVLTPVGDIDQANFSAFLEANYDSKFDDVESPNAKLNLVPWYSPSGSYLQLEEVSGATLRCNKRATFNVLLSAQGTPRVRYLIKSRGSIIESGAVSAEGAAGFVGGGGVVIGNGSFDGVKWLTFDVNVTSAFSPASHILAYFMAEEGEVVADAVVVNVNKCLRTHVTTRWTKDVSLPGDANGLELRTVPNATCSVAVTDRATKLLSKSTEFNKEQVFRALKKFESTPRPLPADSCRKGEFVGGGWEWDDGYLTSTTTTEKPSSFHNFPEPDSRFVDSLQAFQDFGGLLITDLLVLTRPCKEESSRLEKSMRNTTRAYGGEAEASTKRSDLVKMLSRQWERSVGFELRNFFPETWIWNLVDVGASGTARLDVVVPHTITEWDSEAICLSPETGLGIAEVKRMTTYQPFFVDFAVPRSVKRKEVFHLSVSVFNYEDHDLPIKLTYVASKGFTVRGDATRFDCVKSKSKVVHAFVLEPATIGEAVVAVTAEVEEDPWQETCGSAPAGKTRDTVSKKTTIRHEGFPVDDVKSGFICGENDNFDSDTSWSIKIPVDIVESSVSAEAFVCGDILGPSLENVDKLVMLPTGCGEQNMVLLAPNILVLEYLLLTKSDDSELVEKALKNLDLGYQKQLNYRRSDGSYSAFGEEDDRGSIWLTAFVVRYLSQAHKFIHIDRNDLNASVSWIVSHQLENGCFPVIGRIYHRDLKGQFFENDSSKALTAYIIISLMESGVVSKSTTTIQNAVYCLKGIEQASGTYADLLTTYALLMVGEVREAQGLMLELLKGANRAYGLLWWDDQDPSTESSVEMTAYGILSLLKLGGSHFTAAASDAVKWITQHRNRNGGFVSSQDTILALEAISKLSASLPRMSEADTLSVRMETTNGNHTFDVSEHNVLLLQRRPLSPYVTDVRFSAVGKGCALVQTHLRYNIRHGIHGNQLKVQLQIDSVSDIDLYFVTKFNVCVRHKSPSDVVKMAVLEVFMVSGFYPDRTSLHSIPISGKGVRKWEEYEEKVVFYFEDLTQKKVCVQFLVNQEACVEKTSPAIIKLYDYYNSKHVTTVKYSLQPECNSNNNSNTGNWLSPLPQEEKVETKRNAPDGLEHDLHTPTEIGPLPVFIPYESNYTLEQNCPYCSDEIPSAFPNVFCSAERVLKVAVEDNFLRVISDLTPRKEPLLPREAAIPFVVSEKCPCEVLTRGTSLALVVAAPPRAFAFDPLEGIRFNNSMSVINVRDEAQLAKGLEEAMLYCREWSHGN